MREHCGVMRIESMIAPAGHALAEVTREHLAPVYDRDHRNDISIWNVAVHHSVRRYDDLAKPGARKLWHLSPTQRKHSEPPDSPSNTGYRVVRTAHRIAGDEAPDLAHVLDRSASPDYFRHASKMRRASS
jgi:hypothetical protein